MASDENWLHTALILHSRSIRFLFHTHLFTYFHGTWKKLFSDLYPSIEVQFIQNSLKLTSRLRGGLHAQTAFLPPSHTEHDQPNTFTYCFCSLLKVHTVLTFD